MATFPQTPKESFENLLYNPTNDPALKGPDIRYETADSTSLGPVKFADDRLSQFMEDWMKSDETIKEFSYLKKCRSNYVRFYHK